MIRHSEKILFLYGVDDNFNGAKKMNTKEEIICLLQEVAGGLPYPEALQQLENINFWEDNDPLTDEEQEELGKFVKDGYTSGRLDSEDGTRVAWQLNWNKWKED